MVSRRVEVVDNVMDKGPKVARIVEPCVEELTGVGRQVDDSDLHKKNVENVEISSFAGLEEAIGRKSCMPVVESNSEVTESLSKPIANDEVFGVLDDAINEVTEAVNPSELRLPAVGNSAIVSASSRYKSFEVGITFETRKKLQELGGRN